MPDEPDGATATVTPLPTMMPGAPQYRVPTRKELQRELISGTGKRHHAWTRLLAAARTSLGEATAENGGAL